MSICYAIIINGVTVSPADPNNGCRWLSTNYTYKSGDVVKWFKRPSGDTTVEVPPTSGLNLLVCPANPGLYWYRVTRSGIGGSCSSDSPAVSVP